MATIKISELRPAGSDLFSDSESYMTELVDSELDSINGGINVIKLTIKAAKSSVACVNAVSSVPCVNITIKVTKINSPNVSMFC